MKSGSIIVGASILVATLLAVGSARANGEKILLSFSSLKYPVFVFTRGVAENEAKKLKTVDRRLENPSKPVFHSGTDNVTGGKAIADYIIQTFPKGASIVLLTGQPGSSPAIDRAKGVKDRLASAGPSYKIVAEQTANWMRDEGLSVT